MSGGRAGDPQAGARGASGGEAGRSRGEAGAAAQAGAGELPAQPADARGGPEARRLAGGSGRAVGGAGEPCAQPAAAAREAERPADEGAARAAATGMAAAGPLGAADAPALSAAQRGVLAAAEAFARAQLAGDSGGHDWWHARRVAANARRLAAAEGADAFVCELAAWLHDVADDKLHADPAAAERELRQWLAASGAGAATAAHVLEIIGTMSFKGGGRPPMRTPEGRVVQDADRLDALGAIGLARTFAYSGWKGRPMHDPALPPRERMTEAEYRSGRDTAINHVHEKLLKLRDLLNTDAARELADGRHRFMEQYLRQFELEWEGEL